MTKEATVTNSGVPPHRKVEKAPQRELPLFGGRVRGGLGGTGVNGHLWQRWAS